MKTDTIPLPPWQAIIARVIAFRSSNEDADIDYDQLVGEELDTEGVAELMLIFTEINTAAWVAKKAMTNELARRMAAEERTSLEVAGTLVTWKPKKGDPKVTDTAGFWEYMKANPDLLEAAFNPNNLRKTGIPSSVFDTFFEVKDGVEPVIGTIPMHIIEKLRNEKERQQ
jgi:hypothetical protein